MTHPDQLEENWENWYVSNSPALVSNKLPELLVRFWF
jgi:hypothetical protein